MTCRVADWGWAPSRISSIGIGRKGLGKNEKGKYTGVGILGVVGSSSD